jgi:phytoene desaturase
MAKCIVIGSGIGGLASAIRLRAKGFEVTVYEASLKPGGKLGELNSLGYRFDTGPSLFTMPFLLEELFELMGEDIKSNFEYISLDHSCHYFYEDGTVFKSPSNPKKFAEKIATEFGENEVDVLNYLNDSEKLYKITSPVFLENSIHHLKSYFNAHIIKGLLNFWRLKIFKTMHEVNRKVFKNSKTVQLFDRFATYNGSSPYLAPATLNVIPHLEYGMGTFFPKKGMYSIAESLFNLASRHGVKFVFNTPVNEIIVDNGKAIGVKINDEKVSADFVISNMDVFPTYKHLLPKVKMPSKVKHVQSSSSALVFYWGINKTFANLDLHNIVFSKSYQNEFASIFNEQTICDDPTIYINISSKYKPSDAPENCENWFVMVNVPANYGQNWQDLIAKTRTHIISKINRVLNVEIENHIVCETILDPITIEERTSSYRGALYGASSNTRMAAFLRHANDSSKIKNLYFCGGSVHPGGGIPLCLQSAKIATNLLFRKHLN